jgi:transposase/5-methylcytosine-specific restriction endonuclease McrA
VEKESLEKLLREGLSVEQIARRLGRSGSTVAYWLEKHGLDAVNREKHSPKGGIERGRLEELVDAGMTIAEIASEVGLSKSSVRHWLGRHGLRTMNAAGRRQNAARRVARQSGLLTISASCPRHGETEFILEGRGYYRCKRCRVERVSRRRRKIKQILVREAGGECVVCGYSRSARALEFHHVNPADKWLPVSANGVTLSLDSLRAEARKCVLLCSNCHAEVEDGKLAAPLHLPEGVGSSTHRNPG